MRILVLGSREEISRDQIYDALENLRKKRDIELLITRYDGCGMIVLNWARARGLRVLVLPSIEGALSARPDGVMALPGAEAADLEFATQAQLPVYHPFKK